MKDIKILVATHKKYLMPKDDIYLPIQVGAEGKENFGFQKDNEGENISIKNPFYCELTGMYWAWKNLKADYIGLAHYRRHFSSTKNTKSKNKFDKLLTRKEAEKILEDVDIILPNKRKYYIENIYDHYKHTMNEEQIEKTEKVIKNKYPEYLKELEELHKRTSAHMFNMFIMKKEIFDKYCEWLFSVLFEVEKFCDPEKYDSFHARYLGRISEILLDVWINTNNMQYKEVKVIDMENVNWIKKGKAFLMAKFFNKKYEKSF